MKSAQVPLFAPHSGYRKRAKRPEFAPSPLPRWLLSLSTLFKNSDGREDIREKKGFCRKKKGLRWEGGMDAAKKANSAKTNTHPPKNLLSSSFLLPPRPPSSLLFSPHPHLHPHPPHPSFRLFVFGSYTNLTRKTHSRYHVYKKTYLFLQTLHSRVLRGNYVVIMPPIAWCCLDRGEYIPHVLPSYGMVQGEGGKYGQT